MILLACLPSVLLWQFVWLAPWMAYTVQREIGDPMIAIA